MNDVKWSLFTISVEVLHYRDINKIEYLLVLNGQSTDKHVINSRRIKIFLWDHHCGGDFACAEQDNNFGIPVEDNLIM